MTTLWKRFMNYVRVKSAIRHADKMHRLTGKRYYVIKVGGRIRVYDRNKIDWLVDSRILTREMRDYYHLIRYCIYHTK